MEIISITIQEQDGELRIGFTASGGVTPGLGEQACRFVGERFRQAAIEAEVQRRPGSAARRGTT